MKAAVLTGTLTISLYTFLLFVCSFPSAHPHHVVFDEISEMAGALLYIHVIILVNISGLSMAVKHFCDKVTLLQKGYGDKAKHAVFLEKYGGRINVENVCEM